MENKLPEYASKLLKEIQARVPKLWRDNVVTEQKKTPTMEMVVKKAMKDKKIPKEKRDKLKVLYDNGDFSKTILVENKKYAKMIDQFVMREIKKEIKKGNLPKKLNETIHTKKD